MNESTDNRRFAFGEKSRQDGCFPMLHRREFLKRATAAGAFAVWAPVLTTPANAQVLEFAWLDLIAEGAVSAAISWLVTKIFDWGLNEFHVLSHRLKAEPAAENLRQGFGGAPNSDDEESPLVLGPDTTITPSGAPVFRSSVQSTLATDNGSPAGARLAFHYSYPEVAARNLIVKPVYSPRFGVGLAIPGRPQCKALKVPIPSTGGLTVPELKAMARQNAAERATLWVSRRHSSGCDF